MRMKERANWWMKSGVWKTKLKSSKCSWNKLCRMQAHKCKTCKLSCSSWSKNTLNTLSSLSLSSHKRNTNCKLSTKIWSRNLHRNTSLSLNNKPNRSRQSMRVCGTRCSKRLTHCWDSSKRRSKRWGQQVVSEKMSSYKKLLNSGKSWLTEQSGLTSSRLN